MTIDQQLAAAEAKLTELQHRLIEHASDADERGRIYDQILKTRRTIDHLSTHQPAA